MRGAKFKVVITIVDDDDSTTEEEAAGFGAGVGGHGVALYVGIAAHHLCGSGKDGRAFGGDALDLDEDVEADVDPEGAIDHVGGLVAGRDGESQTWTAVNGLRDAGLEAHVVVRGGEPGLGDFGGVVDGFFVFEERAKAVLLDER